MGHAAERERASSHEVTTRNVHVRPSIECSQRRCTSPFARPGLGRRKGRAGGWIESSCGGERTSRRTRRSDLPYCKLGRPDSGLQLGWPP